MQLLVPVRLNDYWGSLQATLNTDHPLIPYIADPRHLTNGLLDLDFYAMNNPRCQQTISVYIRHRPHSPKTARFEVVALSEEASKIERKHVSKKMVINIFI
jgi:hypothetical protein